MQYQRLRDYIRVTSEAVEQTLREWLGNYGLSIPERFAMSWREGMDGNGLRTNRVIGIA